MKAELATYADFKLVQRYDGMPQEQLDELRDQLADLDQDPAASFRKIKLQAGGGLAFEIQQDDDVIYEKELHAVILFMHRQNAYWAGPYGGGENSIPECVSMDAITGISLADGQRHACASCPMNQFGSARDAAGNFTKGKACRNTRRMFLLLNGDPNLYVLTLPPTSIPGVNKQLSKLLTSGMKYTSTLVKFSLEKFTSGAGIAYSRVVIARDRELDPATAVQVAQLREGIKANYQAALRPPEKPAQAAPAATRLDDIPVFDCDDR